MKVSVITTLYNYRQYLGDCIESFLRQDFRESELVVVDDASTDDPQPVIDKYKSKRIQYIRLDQNGGYSHAKNVGIRSARSDVLVMLDADDMLTKTGISSRYSRLQEGFDLVHGPAITLKEDGRLIPDTKRLAKWVASPKDHTSYQLIHAQTVMLRKSIHSKVGLYDETLRCKSDREMWARILARPEFRVSWVNEPVAVYRSHKKQMHRSKYKLQNNERLEAEVKAKIEKRRTDLTGLPTL